MIVLIEIIAGLGLAIFVLVGTFKEINDGAKNNGDERWRMIISKSDQTALNAFVGISFFSFMIPSILKGIGYLNLRFSISFLNALPNDFSDSFYGGYPLYLMLTVMAIRFISIELYKKKY
ncbi:hypothetical protein [Marinilactibacillus kalidii]|uniref:hypothetical protein n=1 Tax=Marinilactibacillus kalidii TaxID=2820274 RepID=UPI001ABDD9CB|nr:hypothetical protein [Marinilactibacillus kalidii]